MWSNSSRWRQESVYLLRTWCLYTWSYLDNLIIIRFSINCSTVICSPTVILMLSWEKPLVKPMALGLSLIIFAFNLLYSHLYFLHLYYKIPKIYLSYHTIFIRSHFLKWPWGDWQPLYRVGCEFSVCLCRCVGILRSLLLDWYLGSQNWGKYLRYTLLHHPLLFGENQPISLAFTLFASRFPLPHFTLAVLFALSFPISSSLFRSPFFCLLVCWITCYHGTR